MWSLMCIDTDKALFVKSVFKREHLTRICSMVFSPFCFFPWDRVSLGSCMMASKHQDCWGAQRPQNTQGEVIEAYINTPATETSRWVLFISSLSPHDGGKSGEGRSKAVFFSCKNKRSQEMSRFWLLCWAVRGCQWLRLESNYSSPPLPPLLPSAISSMCPVPFSSMCPVPLAWFACHISPLLSQRHGSAQWRTQWATGVQDSTGSWGWGRVESWSPISSNGKSLEQPKPFLVCWEEWGTTAN